MKQLEDSLGKLPTHTYKEKQQIHKNVKPNVH